MIIVCCYIQVSTYSISTELHFLIVRSVLISSKAKHQGKSLIFKEYPEIRQLLIKYQPHALSGNPHKKLVKTEIHVGFKGQNNSIRKKKCAPLPRLCKQTCCTFCISSKRHSQNLSPSKIYINWVMWQSRRDNRKLRHVQRNIHRSDFQRY